MPKFIDNFGCAIRACKQLLRNKCSTKKGCILYSLEKISGNFLPELKSNNVK